MPRRSTRNQRSQAQKVTRSELRRKLGKLDMDEEETKSTGTLAGEASGTDTTTHPTHGPTKIEISTYPLVERWEQIEDAERAEIQKKHKARTSPFAFEPEYLPFQIHAAVPIHGRFTREIESDIVKCNSIEAIKDIAKSSLPLEFQRSNMKLDETKFAGIMTYGPTPEFSKKSIHNVTRGLFLDEDAYKKWWLTVNMTKREPGDMVKVAVVLWHVEEAKAKAIQLPDFWTEENVRVLGNQLEKLDWPIFMSQSELEEGCRAYEKLQGQLQEARNDAVLASSWQDQVKEAEAKLRKLAAAYKKMSGQVKAMSDALEKGEMKKLGALMAATMKVIEAKEKAEEKGKGKAKAAPAKPLAFVPVEESEEEAEEDVAADGGDDPYDDDYNPLLDF
ncbi:hypothetical protein ABEF95_004434 [Exophiala dermatitidis]